MADDKNLQDRKIQPGEGQAQQNQQQQQVQKDRQEAQDAANRQQGVTADQAGKPTQK